MNELAGSLDKYKDFFAATEKTSSVPIGFEAIKSGTNGYYHLEEKRIAIDEGMSELQNFKNGHTRISALTASRHRKKRAQRYPAPGQAHP